MKKIFVFSLLTCFLALILFVGIVPRLLSFKSAQKTLAEQLGRSLNSEISVENIEWNWLPLPHLSLINTSLANAYSRCFLPHTNIFPNWRIIFGKDFIPGTIQLINADIYIKDQIQRPGNNKAGATSLPALNLAVVNGKISFVTPERYRDVVREDILQFNTINGSLKIESQQVTLKFKASSPYSKDLNLQGWLNLEKKNYRVIADCRDFRLQTLVKSFYGGNLVPAASSSNLQITAAGTGLQNMDVNLKGILPGFLIKHNGHEVLLDNANVDLALIKAGPLLRLTVKKLEMADPLIRLSGKIESRTAANQAGAESIKTDPARTWILDMTGTDLDLSAIRQKVLSLWGDNRTAIIVCNIVRGGRASSGAYRFSGRATDFSNLDAMTIEADVLEADINVPGAELNLTRASGPIMIKDSFLTGSGLSASLGKSHGSNGKLLLDLSGRSSAFSLDIDINADLADLPPVLELLVHQDVFQRELHKFKSVSGRASANLKLGNTLHNIITRVDVRDMQFSTSYDLLPQTVIIDKGALQVEPQKVSWQKISGHTGLQKIFNTSGNVSWQDGEVMMHIDDTSGQLDGNSLLETLQQTEVVKDKITKRLDSLEGSIEFSAGTLQGPANLPESWNYRFTVKSDDLAFSSPLLPDFVTSGKLAATVSDTEINITEAEVWFLDQPVALNGIFTHNVLENWQGRVEFNGSVQQKLAAWLESKGWFSEKLRPKIPCRVENLVVRIQGKTTAVSGLILPGLSSARLPMARIDLENTPEHLLLKELTFYAPGEQGRLSIDYQHQLPYRLVFSWEGFATFATISTLFQSSIFTSGSFSGAFFEISYLADHPGETRFKGLLKAENLLLKNNDDEVSPIIKNIVMSGVGKQLRISTLDLAIGADEIKGRGTLAADEKGLQLNFDIESPQLSDKSLNALAQAAKENKSILVSGPLEAQDRMLLLKDWNLTGQLAFRLDSYSFNRDTLLPYGGLTPVIYTLHQVQGRVKLVPKSLTETEIFSAELCGLEFKGSWGSDRNSPQSFHLRTPSEGVFLLENVLPCLGVNQNLVEGEFSLLANLKKESGIWQTGNISLKSTEGRILRLQTLSRIFKVVNVTDLFDEQVGNARKRGFPFTQMDIDSHIDNGILILDRGIIRGEGLNLFYHGNIFLDDFDVDLTLLIAPLKTFDSIIAKVPLIGQPVMEKYESVVTIPVAVKGPIGNPVVTPLHPSAVSDAILNIVKDTLLMPYSILKPESQ